MVKVFNDVYFGLFLGDIIVLFGYWIVFEGFLVVKSCLRDGFIVRSICFVIYIVFYFINIEYVRYWV